MRAELTGQFAPHDHDPPRPNPSRGTWIFLGIVAAAGIGGWIFLRSRKAAAASAGTKAFSVSADCKSIAVLDESAARAAATAAAIAVHPGPGDDALQAAIAALGIVLPQCNWQSAPDDRMFSFRGQSLSWAQIKDMLAGKTVGEVTSMVGVAEDGELPEELPPLVLWLISSPFGSP